MYIFDVEMDGYMDIFRNVAAHVAVGFERARKMPQAEPARIAQSAGKDT